MKVEILSRTLIRPSSTTYEHPREVKLSSMDQLMPGGGIPLIIYYTSTGVAIDAKVKSKMFQESLSEILTLYYPLAGRCIEDNRTINCSDEGAEFVEAQVSGQLDQLLNGEPDTTQLNNFLQWQFDMSTGIQLTVQVNMFDCGGVALGICFSHWVGDGFTMTKFINDWATTCREGIHKVASPMFNMASLFPTKVLPESTVSSLGIKPTITKLFVFDGASISNLKAIVSNDSKVVPTRVQMVTALLWKTLINMSIAEQGLWKEIIVGHGVNMRGKLLLPESNESCGNLVRGAMARFMPTNTSKNNAMLHDLVCLIGDAIRNTSTDSTKHMNGEDLFNAINDEQMKMKEEIGKGECKYYVFTSWCRFPIYNADFGWGRPAWAGISKMDFEIIILMDSRDGDGIEAWVTLDESEMLSFQKDSDIVTFTTTR